MAHVGRNTILVVHDWGSALGFNRAFRFPDQIAGIVHMESIVLPRRWEWFGSIEGMFKALRSPGLQGEEFCLEKNLFVEKTIPEHVIRTLSDEEMARYRAPYETREARLPTLIWAREVAIEEERRPADVYALVNAYSAWLREQPRHAKAIHQGGPWPHTPGWRRGACLLPFVAEPA